MITYKDTDLVLVTHYGGRYIGDTMISNQGVLVNEDDHYTELAWSLLRDHYSKLGIDIEEELL